MRGTSTSLAWRAPLRRLLRRTGGMANSEYMMVTAAGAVATILSAPLVFGTTEENFDEATWDVKRERLVSHGYVSDHADQKVMGVAEDYTGTVTFIFEEAGYRNALGMYRFAADGTITDVEIIFSNASAQGSGGDLIPGESSVEVALRERDQIGFFVASNAYSRNSAVYLTEGSYVLLDRDGAPATIHSTGLLTLYNVDGTTGQMRPVRTQYARNLFYSHSDPDNDHAPNIDRYPHTVGYVDTETGIVTLGFEDLYSGGDNDYDDIVLEFDIGRSNAAVLDHNLDYGNYDGYDAWVSRLRLWENSAE